MKCFFCEGKIGKDDVDFTLILNNAGSTKDGQKMPTCFDCVQFLFKKKGKNFIKGAILR